MRKKQPLASPFAADCCRAGIMASLFSEEETNLLTRHITDRTQELCSIYAEIGEGFQEEFDHLIAEIVNTFTKATQNATAVKEKLLKKLKDAIEYAHSLINLLFENENTAEPIKQLVDIQQADMSLVQKLRDTLFL